jgi:formylglycine-generating enzyme required for sulfatase activity/predicted Ser/Thr protein kinase
MHPEFDDLVRDRLQPEVLVHLLQCPRCREDRSAWRGEEGLPQRPMLEVQPQQGAPRWELCGWLGRGGMGEVFQAYDHELGRTVAIKVQRSDRGDPALAERLVREARMTASLQHPAIVSVHQMGRLQDGRPFYVMKEIRGLALRALMAGAEGQPLSLRRGVDMLQRVCDAAAYAHAHGVVHRDLKPENILLGEFNELTLVDFGLSSDAEEGTPGQGGTAGYLAPELLDGGPAAPAADVYAIGVMLYEMLAGRLPWCTLAERLHQPPPPLPAGLPEALVTSCARAMEREPEARPSALALGEDLRRWLDGEQRTAEARLRLVGADALLHEASALRVRARELEAAAHHKLDTIRPHEPVEAKQEAWALQDQADEARARAEVLDLDYVQMLQRALDLAPELLEARTRLGRHHQQALMEAERRGEVREVRRLRKVLEAHSPETAAWLRTPARLVLHTEPAGASVCAEEVVAQDRRWIPRSARVLGVTPLRETLPAGRWRLTVRTTGRAEAVFPVDLQREDLFDPGPISLPEPIWGAVLVPAGWFLAGGDPLAPDALSRRRIWVDTFAIQTHPVTVAEYVAFLNELPEELALEHQPRESAGYGAGSRSVLARRGAQWLLETSPHEGPPWEPDWPVVLVDPADAEAYARWWSAKTGLTWALPHDLEWEKAARGADGRAFPWGDLADPSFANMIQSHEGAPKRTSVTRFRYDQSPYGVYGLGGNVRDWCCNGYRRDGDIADGERLIIRPRAADEPYHMVRGGSWTSVESWCRSAGRFAGYPIGSTSVGFRLVCREIRRLGT